MKREINTKYFDVSQNNSCGYFIENEHVGAYIIIEAISAQEAESKLYDIVEDYSEYCSCCGERWYACFSDEDGTDTPTIYGEDAYNYNDRSFSASTVIYHIDGRVERLRFEEDE